LTETEATSPKSEGSALDKLRAEILGEAEEEVSKILTKAEEEAAAIVEDAKSEADRIVQSRVGQAEAEARDLRRRAIASTELDRRMSLMKCKEEIIESVFSDAIERLKNACKGLESTSILTKMIIRASTALEGGELDVIVPSESISKLDARKIEEEVTRAVNTNTVVSITSEGFPRDSIGGVIVRKGSVWVDDTIEAIISRRRRDLRTEVARTLFG
jgi:V/A-type H+-transporting ATPase subunit E